MEKKDKIQIIFEVNTLVMIAFQTALMVVLILNDGKFTSPAIWLAGIAGCFTVIEFIILMKLIKIKKQEQRDMPENGKKKVGEGWKGEYENRPFECEYKFWQEDCYFRLRYFVAFPLELKIKKRGRLTNFLEKIGLIKTVKTGDEEFDNRFLIQTENVSRATDCFHDAASRECIREIFAIEPVCGIRFNPESVDVLFDVITNETDPEAIVGQALEILARLNIPSSSPKPGPAAEPSPRKTRMSTTKLTLLSAMPLSLLFGVALFSLLEYRPLDNGIWLAAVKFSILATISVGGAIVLIIHRLIRGRHDFYIIFPICLFGYPLAVMALCMGYFFFSNQYFDDSPKIRHIAKISDKKSEKLERGFRYRLCFTPSKDNGGVREINVAEWVYDKVEVDEPYVIVYKKGYRGFKWLVAHRKYNPVCEDMFDDSDKMFARHNGVSSLAKTSWEGLGVFGKKMEFEFQPDGVFRYKIHRGKKKNETGKWKQAGDWVRLEIRRGWGVFLGKIDENEIRGNVCNKYGDHWKFHAVRKK